jgi:MoaA/NifB/PqqE/SkfB family radical SAM enzyme
MGKGENKLLITGISAARIKWKAGIILVSISFSTFRNPVRALKAIRLLFNQRKRLHGNRKDHKIVKSGNRYFWSIYTPGFPSDRFNDVIRREIRRALSGTGTGIPLQTLILSISSRCDYKCEHCFEADKLNGKELLSLQDLSKVMKDAFQNKVRHIQFGGGEPMLRMEDMIRIMYQAHGTMDFWISTSGSGLTHEKATLLKKAGMTGATISLDHWNKDDHDRFRNFSGAFDSAVEAVENCNSAGIITNLTLCVTREMANQDNLIRYLKFARELRVPFVRFLEPRKVGNYAGKDVLLREKEQRVILDFYLRMNSERKYSSYPIIQYPGYHQRKLGCFGSGNRYMYINSRGDYQGCPFCPGTVGNIRQMNLQGAIALLQSRGCQLFKTNYET